MNTTQPCSLDHYWLILSTCTTAARNWINISTDQCTGLCCWFGSIPCVCLWVSCLLPCQFLSPPSLLVTYQINAPTENVLGCKGQLHSQWNAIDTDVRDSITFGAVISGPLLHVPLGSATFSLLKHVDVASILIPEALQSGHFPRTQSWSGKDHYGRGKDHYGLVAWIRTSNHHCSRNIMNDCCNVGRCCEPSWGSL
jgi:hypothetical protein